MRNRHAPPPTLLRILFAVAFTPAARVLRLAGIDRLGLRPRPGAKSFWFVRRDRPVDLNSQS